MVGSITSVEFVIPLTTAQHVRARVPVERVVTITTGQRIVSVAPAGFKVPVECRQCTDRVVTILSVDNNPGRELGIHSRQRDRVISVGTVDRQHVSRNQERDRFGAVNRHPRPIIGCDRVVLDQDAVPGTIGHINRVRLGQQGPAQVDQSGKIQLGEFLAFPAGQRGIHRRFLPIVGNPLAPVPVVGSQWHVGQSVEFGQGCRALEFPLVYPLGPGRVRVRDPQQVSKFVNRDRIEIDFSGVESGRGRAEVPGGQGIERDRSSPRSEIGRSRQQCTVLAPGPDPIQPVRSAGGRETSIATPSHIIPVQVTGTGKDVQRVGGNDQVTFAGGHPGLGVDEGRRPGIRTAGRQVVEFVIESAAQVRTGLFEDVSTSLVIEEPGRVIAVIEHELNAQQRPILESLDQSGDGNDCRFSAAPCSASNATAAFPRAYLERAKQHVVNPGSRWSLARQPHYRTRREPVAQKKPATDCHRATGGRFRNSQPGKQTGVIGRIRDPCRRIQS